MIYAVFILDSSGMPVHTWKYSKAPSTLFKGKDETLVAGLISALLNFGQETFAAPQRIDFNDYALTFFTFELGDRSYWIIAVSDIKDHRVATTRFLKILSKRLQRILSEASLEDGLFLDMGGVGSRIDEIIEQTLNENIRFLPTIRSAGLGSIPVTLPLSIIVPFLINFLFGGLFQIVAHSLGTIGVLLVFSLQIILTGALIGIISSDGLTGFINAFTANIVSYLINLLLQGATVGEQFYTILLIAIVFISPLAGIVGGVIGYLVDIRKLKVV